MTGYEGWPGAGAAGVMVVPTVSVSFEISVGNRETEMQRGPYTQIEYETGFLCVLTLVLLVGVVVGLLF